MMTPPWRRLVDASIGLAGRLAVSRFLGITVPNTADSAGWPAGWPAGCFWIPGKQESKKTAGWAGWPAGWVILVQLAGQLAGLFGRQVCRLGWAGRHDKSHLGVSTPRTLFSK